LLLLALLTAAAAWSQSLGEADTLVPDLSGYVSPMSPRDMLGWAEEGQTVTLYTRAGDACLPIQMTRGPDDYLGRVDTCTLEYSGAKTVTRSCELRLGASARLLSCAEDGRPIPGRDGLGLSLGLVIDDPLHAHYAPVVTLQVDCPRSQQVQHCTSGEQRVCSGCASFHLLERGGDGLVSVREAVVSPPAPVDCSLPCEPGMVDPEGKAAALNRALVDRRWVPMAPNRGLAVYTDQGLCEADEGWGASLLRDPACSRDRLRVRVDEAWRACVKPRSKDLGLRVELQALVGPTGRVLSVAVDSDSPRARLWHSCLLEELHDFPAGQGTPGHAWTFTDTRVLEAVAD